MKPAKSTRSHMKRTSFCLIRFLALALVVAGIGICCMCMVYMRRYDGRMTPMMLPPSGRVLEPEKRVVRFAVIGDFDVRNDGIERAGAEIRSLGADFVLCTGDIAKKPQDVRHFHWIAERIHDAFGDIPFMATPGNHDRESKEAFEEGLRPYELIFGHPEYWFGYGDCMFVSLNTSRETLPPGGIKNLREMLQQERGNFQRLVIFSHVPPIDLRGGKPDCLPEVDAGQLDSLLPEYSPTLYLCGHHHNYSSSKFAGSTLVTTPALGQQNRSGSHGNGFLMVTLPEKGEPVVELHEISGGETCSLEYFMASKLNLTPTGFIVGVVCIVLGVAIMFFRRRTEQNPQVCGKNVTPNCP